MCVLAWMLVCVCMCVYMHACVRVRTCVRVCVLALVYVSLMLFVERMWQELGSTPVELAASDQTRFSSILITSNITWTPFDYDTNYYLKGKSQNKDITVIALPQEVVCRNQCNATRLSSYYAYHPMTTHHVDVKHDVMTAQKVWRVSNRWNLTCKTVQSTMDWLNEVTAG